MVMSPAGLGLENDCADEAQQQLKTTDPSSHQILLVCGSPYELQSAGSRRIVAAGRFRTAGV
jgi:hypothetical protein